MRQTLARLWPYVTRYRWLYVTGALCVIAAASLRMAVPAFLGEGIDDLRGAADATSDGADRNRIAGLVAQAGIAILVAAVLGAIFRTASRLCILGNSRRVVHDLRRDLLTKLMRLAPSFYVRHQTGHVMSRCVNDVQNVQGLTGPVTMYLVETGVLYAVGVTFMVRTDPLLTVCGLAPFPFFLLFAHRLARRIQEGSRAAQERLGDLSAKVDESLSGQRVIRSLGLEDHDAESFEKVANAYREVALEVARYRAILQPAMLLLAGLSTMIVLAVGGPRVVAGDTTVGSLFAMILYLGMVAMPTRTLGFVLSSLQRGTAAFRRILEILDMHEGLTDPRESRSATTDHRPSRGQVSVRGLTVTYRPLDEEPHLSDSLPDLDEEVQGARTVLSNVSFDVPAGGRLGIVGPVGSGKSVLLRALARQLEVDPETVFLDGEDVTGLPLAAVRSTVGLVPQEPFLFSATVRDNVAIAVPDAVDERVWQAVRTAQMERDLEQLPAGLETLLGDRGVNLSGGQRQRTAIARVALMGPTLLLLDDCLSAVDADTSERILRELEPLMKGRTTVVVAHRLATVRGADRILVLDEGRVVESGTHDDLVARDGLYAGMYREQREHEGDAGSGGGA